MTLLRRVGEIHFTIPANWRATIKEPPITNFGSLDDEDLLKLQKIIDRRLTDLDHGNRITILSGEITRARRSLQAKGILCPTDQEMVVELIHFNYRMLLGINNELNREKLN